MPVVVYTPNSGAEPSEATEILRSERTAALLAALASDPRRVVLIDFDWQDADLLPALLRQPDLTVRLVAGDGEQQPGLKVAEVCGLPRTLDLADLTRESFDLALVSERSPRRTQGRGPVARTGHAQPDAGGVLDRARPP